MIDEITDFEDGADKMAGLFFKAKDEFHEAIDSHIQAIDYAQSQIELAKKKAALYNARAKTFEKLMTMFQRAAVLAIERHPDLEFKGTLGKLKAVKNAQPIINMPADIDVKDPRLAPYHQIKEIDIIDRDTLKADLKAGKEIDGFSLSWGKHLRISI